MMTLLLRRVSLGMYLGYSKAGAWEPVATYNTSHIIGHKTGGLYSLSGRTSYRKISWNL